MTISDRDERALVDMAGASDAGAAYFQERALIAKANADTLKTG